MSCDSQIKYEDEKKTKKYPVMTYMYVNKIKK